MARRKTFRLYMKDVGPINEADVTFGDLTVIVGPQATGKSIFLQTLKLLLDLDVVHATFRRYNLVFNRNGDAFLGGYYGKGMAGAWKADSSELIWNGKKISLPDLARPRRVKDAPTKLFFIPAQRVMSLTNGVTQNFGQFNYGDPYTLRDFSNTVHDLLQNEFGAKGDIFPMTNRLNDTLRKPIKEHIYGGNKVTVNAQDFTKRLTLSIPGHKEGLPYTAWSAGQREFTPLLLGLYWLCPAGSISMRDQIEWVVVEEPEMGLHPQGIEAVLLLVLELLRRGYRVVVSTHSPVVLDLIWALQMFKRNSGNEADVRKLLSLGAKEKKLAQNILDKEYRVYYFNRGSKTHEISNLSPLSDKKDEAEWGGLVGFASRAGEVIADVVNRAPNKPRRRRAATKRGSVQA